MIDKMDQNREENVCDKSEWSTTGRVDVNKMVNEYQKTFNVPKPLIIKWLNVQNQKSLFGTKHGGSIPTGSIRSSKLMNWFNYNWNEEKLTYQRNNNLR